MRIFVLEDNFERQKIFKEKLKNHEVVLFDNAIEAIDFLKTDIDFDAMYLDHDLGNEVYVDIKEKNTGSEVARFLSNKDVRAKIVIHSFNAIGAQNMQNYLFEAIHIPFSKQIFNGL